MSSRVGGIGSTLTGGIQDIAAILPLLGTEQWTYYTFGSVRATSKMVVIDCHFSVVMRGADGVMLR